MAFGVDSTGFTPKTVTDITASIGAGYRAVYGAAVNIAARSRIGQRIALFAGALAEVWELGEALFNAMDPDAATGSALDNQLKLVGLARKPATSSKVTLSLTGANGTVVGAGKVGKVPNSTNRFSTDGSATLATATEWTSGTPYALGTIRSNGGNIYVCSFAGTSAGSGGPTGTGRGIVDNSCEWDFVGPGVAYATSPATATATGPVNGFAETITEIETPVSGWSGVNNLLDASLGSNIELDPDARTRRDQSQSRGAANALAAVKAAVLNVAGVTTCNTFENTGDATVDSVPPHSFETLVEGGIDADVAAAIFSKRPGGIQAYGTTVVTVSDSESNAYAIGFSRPTDVDITVALRILYDPVIYPGTDQTPLANAIADAVAVRQNQRKVGQDVVSSAISAGVFRDIPGIIDVTECDIAKPAHLLSPATIPLTPRERGVFDSSRITSVLSPGSL